MAPSHAVEWIDLKEGTLCGSCQALVFGAEDQSIEAKAPPF